MPQSEQKPGEFRTGKHWEETTAEPSTWCQSRSPRYNFGCRLWEELPCLRLLDSRAGLRQGTAFSKPCPHTKQNGFRKSAPSTPNFYFLTAGVACAACCVVAGCSLAAFSPPLCASFPFLSCSASSWVVWLNCCTRPAYCSEVKTRLFLSIAIPASDSNWPG